jgi:DNA primase
VRVEGPLDALAVSLAGGGRFVGAAPLGTSLTEEQAAELARAARRSGAAPVVATDADLAGRIAAQRDYWLLTQHGAAPQGTSALAGSDPAEMLETRGADALRAALFDAQPLSDTLLQERLEALPGTAALRPSVTVLASAAPQEWDAGAERIAASTGLPVEAVRRALARAVQRWESDPRVVAGEQINDLSAVRDRAKVDTTPAASATGAPAPRGLPVAPSLPAAPEPGAAPRR